jgi:putative protease
MYVTVNVMPRTGEYEELSEYLMFLGDIKADAAIISDLGVIDLVKNKAPGLPIHISTQASVVSAQTCIAYQKLGASRIVLARELTLAEIAKIRDGIPDELELEAFVHGSMCIAYSGRCLLSNYFTGRDANHGQCAQPCRWKYSPSAMDISEEKRADLPTVGTVEEDRNGETFFMSSKDTCMIEHIPELENSGIDSYKIEGRVKSAYYTAVVTNTYRMAIDRYRSDPDAYSVDPEWLRELEGVSHREYGTGFFFGDPSESANTVTEHGYIRDKSFLATADEVSAGPEDDGRFIVTFIQKNKLCLNDRAEILSPGMTGKSFEVTEILDDEGTPIDSTPHPSMRFVLRVPFKVKKGDILRQA